MENLELLDNLPEAESARIQGLVDEDMLSLEDIGNIMRDPKTADSILDDLEEQRDESRAFEAALKAHKGDIADFIQAQIFGPGGVGLSARDLTVAMEENPRAAEMIKAIFDSDGDGKISQDELDNPDIDAVRKGMGFTDDIKDIISADGGWTNGDPIAASAGAWRKKAISQISATYNERKAKGDDDLNKYQGNYDTHLRNMGVPNAKHIPALKANARKIRGYQKLIKDTGHFVWKTNDLKERWRNEKDPEQKTILGAQYRQAYKDMVANKQRLTEWKDSLSDIAALGIDIDKVNVSKGALKKFDKYRDKLAGHKDYMNKLEDMNNIKDLPEDELERLLG